VVFSPPPTDEQVLEAVEANKRFPNSITKASQHIGLSTTGYKNRLSLAAKRGLLGTKPVLPGFEITKTTAVTNEDGDVVREFIQQKPEHGEEFEVPAGHSIKGVSALIDGDGRTIQQWIKTKEGEYDPRSIAEWLKEAFDGYESPVKAKPKPYISDDKLTLVPANDWHLGLHVWGKEVDDINWDLKIAEDTIGAAVEETIARSPPSSTCIILGGGDLVHADNSSNTTARSGNLLQVDGRYPKIVQAAGRLKVRTIDAALEHHGTVIVRVLPGNHDEHTAIAIAYFLLAWYRNEPRVIVDVDPSLFFWHRFGSVLLGATHGHTVKINQMPSIMAHRRAEDWGVTRHRYVHGFHLHHSAKIATEGDGVICEIHQAPIPQDAWHHNSGYLSGRSMQAITYHIEYGEIGRVRTAILDGARS